MLELEKQTHNAKVLIVAQGGLLVAFLSILQLKDVSSPLADLHIKCSHKRAKLGGGKIVNYFKEVLPSLIAPSPLPPGK